MNQPGQGRKKRPTALLGIDGGLLRPNEPKPARATVRMPSGMSERAKQEWRRLAPDMIAKGVLTFWDVNLFRAYCDQFWILDEARREIEERGSTVPGRNGEPVRNPAFSIYRDTIDMINRIGAKFGLSPSDRAGLKIAPNQPRGGIEDFR